MGDKEDNRPRIAGFNDEQLAAADERIAQLETMLANAEDLRDAGMVTSEQIAEMRRTIEQAKKIRKVMDIRLPG